MTTALESIGWTSAGTLGRGDDPTEAAAGVDLLVIAVPDHSIASVAASVAPGDAIVIHLAGSRPLADLRPHERVASIHPLVSLPDPSTGAARLLGGAVFAIAGDPIVGDIVKRLHGQAVFVSDGQRSLYHATAAVASNHLVALCGQVERLAADVGIPIEAYWSLMSDTLENVTATDAASALTGPAARADWQTISNHVDALPPAERPLYESLSRAAAELAGHRWMDEGPPEITSNARDDERRT